MSNATKITTHVEDAKKRLLFQYRGKQSVEDLIRIFAGDQIQEFEDDSIPLLDRLDIDASIGVQLDAIGTIVGLKRLGLDDLTYRIFLKAQVAKNVSEGDVERIISAWRIITGGDVVHFLEAFPAEFNLFSSKALPQQFLSFAVQFADDIAGAGIAVGFIAVFDPDEAFGFQDSGSNTSGFGDANNPAKGGKFAFIQDPLTALGFNLPTFAFDEDSEPDPDNDGFGDITGPDIVVNGGFDTDTVWAKGTGWSIAGGLATSDGSQAGVSDLTQGASPTNGIKYAVSVVTQGITAGSVTPVIGGTVGTAITGNGTTQESIVSGAGGDVVLQASADFVGSIDIAAVEPLLGVSTTGGKLAFIPTI